MINHLSLVQNAFSVYKERDNYIATHLVRKNTTTKIVKSQERKSHQPKQPKLPTNNPTEGTPTAAAEDRTEQITLHYIETTCSIQKITLRR